MVDLIDGSLHRDKELTNIHRCVLAMYVYFPELCGKHHMHITRMGFEPTTFAVFLQTRAMSYQTMEDSSQYFSYFCYYD